jgi:hypothetical protein
MEAVAMANEMNEIKMKPISADVLPGVGRKVRLRFAEAIAKYSLHKVLIEEARHKFPTLTDEEVRNHITDIYGEGLSDAFALNLVKKGREKWSQLTDKEIIYLIIDGALQ